MNLMRSTAAYADGDPRKAVIDHFNAMWREKQGTHELIDWAALIAELIHAYMVEVPVGDEK